MPALPGYTLEDIIYWKGNQARAAEYLGVDPATITRKKGTIPGPYFMARMATRLGVSVAEIIQEYELRKQDVTADWERSHRNHKNK